MNEYQYYYRVNNCKAENSFCDDCICWHDEETGPFKEELHTEPVTTFAWREKPHLTKDKQKESK